MTWLRGGWSVDWDCWRSNLILAFLLVVFQMGTERWAGRMWRLQRTCCTPSHCTTTLPPRPLLSSTTTFPQNTQGKHAHKQKQNTYIYTLIHLRTPTNYELRQKECSLCSAKKKNTNVLLLWDLLSQSINYTHFTDFTFESRTLEQNADWILCFRFGQEKKDVLEDSVFNSPNQPPLKRPKLQPSPSPLHHQVRK